MCADALKELRSSQPRLFLTLQNFNFNPASYLHPSRRVEFFESRLPDRVWQESRVVQRLSLQMLKEMDLLSKPYLNFPHPKWSLALLSPQRLARLATHVGAVVLGSQIRTALARDQVVAWKDMLGAEAYQFVLNSAQLLPVIPTRASGSLPEHAQLIGYSMIAHSLADAPSSMYLRALLKMPPIDSAAFDGGNAAQIVHTILIILEAEWHSLFVVKKH